MKCFIGEETINVTFYLLPKCNFHRIPLEIKRFNHQIPLGSSAAPAPAKSPKATAKPATPPETPKAAEPTVGKAPEEAAKPPVKGMVWVNTKSKVYHVEGDRYYGKTKSGEWMTEDEAIKKGYRKSKQETKTKK